MMVSKYCWAACATVLVAGAAYADDVDRGFGALDDSPRFMLYVHKQIGAPRHKTAGPSFGFAIDRSQSTKVLDLRFAPADGALLIVSCATDNEPCDDGGGGSGYTPPGE